MDEFDIIRRYFAPLAAPFPGSLNLTDDAAVIEIPEGCELVVTKDAISEGVHFLGTEEPALIAQKLLRTNLSDLAAMGAKPMAYFLAGILPKSTNEAWVKSFAEGLAKDQKEFNIHLAGGDTISTQGTLSLSLTALGTVAKGEALRRSGAQVGDVIFVSGTLGDSVLGLKLLQGKVKTKLSKQDQTFLQQRYLVPQPRLELGQQLVGIASACMDISDGLMQDLGHLCKASGVHATVELKRLPASNAAYALVSENAELALSAFFGGDDYELLFTVPKDKVQLVPAGCTHIGIMEDGIGVTIMSDDGTPLAIPAGYKHFS